MLQHLIGPVPITRYMTLDNSNQQCFFVQENLSRNLNLNSMNMNNTVQLPLYLCSRTNGAFTVSCGSVSGLRGLFEIREHLSLVYLPCFGVSPVPLLLHSSHPHSHTDLPAPGPTSTEANIAWVLHGLNVATAKLHSMRMVNCNSH